MNTSFFTTALQIGLSAGWLFFCAAYSLQGFSHRRS